MASALVTSPAEMEMFYGGPYVCHGKTMDPKEMGISPGILWPEKGKTTATEKTCSPERYFTAVTTCQTLSEMNLQSRQGWIKDGLSTP